MEVKWFKWNFLSTKGNQDCLIMISLDFHCDAISFSGTNESFFVKKYKCQWNFGHKENDFQIKQLYQIKSNKMGLFGNKVSNENNRELHKDANKHHGIR
jgi:hypothetical protein